MCNLCTMETQTEHQSVCGKPLLLRITQYGSSEQCREYSIQRKTQSCLESAKVKLLSGSLLLLVLCLNLSCAAGIVASAVMALLLIYSFAWEVKREDLLVIAPVGIQFTATFLLGQQITCFIPWQHVRDILIIEAISMQRVLFNLVVYTESCQDVEPEIHKQLIPLFQGMRPRLACLELIYQGVHDLLSNKQ